MDFYKTINESKININAINYLWDYRPLAWGTQDKISKQILILKDLHRKIPFDDYTKEVVDVIAATFSKHFVFKLPLAKTEYIFCLVPSHNANTENKNGIYMFSRWCKSIRDFFDKDIIIRTEDTEALHSGGNRNIDVHLNSLKINKNVKGKRIVVMDDVTTTGNSLAACKSLLLKAGAKEVILFSFAKTISYNS
jgi:predicted amidophosphoribosyltransferase